MNGTPKIEKDDTIRVIDRWGNSLFYFSASSAVANVDFLSISREVMSPYPTDVIIDTLSPISTINLNIAQSQQLITKEDRIGYINFKFTKSEKYVKIPIYYLSFWIKKRQGEAYSMSDVIKVPFAVSEKFDSIPQLGLFGFIAWHQVCLLAGKNLNKQKKIPIDGYKKVHAISMKHSNNTIENNQKTLNPPEWEFILGD